MQCSSSGDSSLRHQLNAPASIDDMETRLVHRYFHRSECLLFATIPENNETDGHCHQPSTKLAKCDAVSCLATLASSGGACGPVSPSSPCSPSSSSSDHEHRSEGNLIKDATMRKEDEGEWGFFPLDPDNSYASERRNGLLLRSKPSRKRQLSFRS